MRREEMANIKDERIVCKICRDTFTFTVGEQGFYKDRQLKKPVRCPNCRRGHRATLVPDENMFKGGK